MLEWLEGYVAGTGPAEPEDPDARELWAELRETPIPDQHHTDEVPEQWLARAAALAVGMIEATPGTPDRAFAVARSIQQAVGWGKFPSRDLFSYPLPAKFEDCREPLRTRWPVELHSGATDPESREYQAYSILRSGRYQDMQNRTAVVVAEAAAQCDLFRDLVAYPFKPVSFDPRWRTSTAVQLARQMDNSNDFSPMPILADALQDAGCDDAEILDHCRADKPHIRGCWVVDLVLSPADRRW
ncbi:MAG TPA: hypothetical protein VKE74_28925 [Gemmataceae bacterium]|nr:hypothetical protein [Gemmataceae bacterium]